MLIIELGLILQQQSIEITKGFLSSAIILNQCNNSIPQQNPSNFFGTERNLLKIKEILSYPNATQIINAPDKDQQTAIFHAAVIEDEDFALEVINMLLQKGADPYHKEDNKESVIYYIASNSIDQIIADRVKTLERMLELGYNLNQNDNYGQTPLFFAASRGRLKCAELLIKNGNSVNHLDNNGQTCLFYAAKEGHLEMCKQLINRGCDPLIVDKFKKTAATWAKLHHHMHVVDYLNMFKKEKNQKLKSNSESMQIEKKGKKKELPKNEYFLVMTGSDGQTRPLTQQQVEEFLKNNQKIAAYLEDPEELETLNATQPYILKTCNKILASLLKRQDTFAFHEPVKWQQMNLLDYPTIVKEPMDYTTMKSKLLYNCYKTQKDFTHDIHLIYNNCIKYNGAESVYGKLAQKLMQQYDQELIKEFTFFDQ